MKRNSVKMFAACVAAVAALSLLAGAGEAGGMRKKALVVMLDGCRADAVENPIFAQAVYNDRKIVYNTYDESFPIHQFIS